jgi:hypothetical protein
MEIKTHSWFRFDDDFKLSADPGNGANQCYEIKSKKSN